MSEMEPLRKTDEVSAGEALSLDALLDDVPDAGALELTELNADGELRGLPLDLVVSEFVARLEQENTLALDNVIQRCVDFSEARAELSAAEMAETARLLRASGPVLIMIAISIVVSRENPDLALTVGLIMLGVLGSLAMVSGGESHITLLAHANKLKYATLKIEELVALPETGLSLTDDFDPVRFSQVVLHQTREYVAAVSAERAAQAKIRDTITAEAEARIRLNAIRAEVGLKPDESE